MTSFASTSPLATDEHTHNIIVCNDGRKSRTQEHIAHGAIKVE